MEDEGKYLYCIIQADQPQSFGPLGIGGGGNDLYTVHWHDLACVVSDSSSSNYPVSREYVMAHHRAVEAVQRRFPALLPICFNTVARAETEIIERVLKTRREEFLHLLRWVADKREAGVRVYWRTMEPVFARIVEDHPEIRVRKEHLLRRPPAARYFEQIELGKQVETALKIAREQEEERIVEGLRPHAVDLRRDPVYGERWILNPAFFVETPRAKSFEQALETLAAPADGNLVFKYLGEGPPFHFVELRIAWEDERDVPH